MNVMSPPQHLMLSAAHSGWTRAARLVAFGGRRALLASVALALVLSACSPRSNSTQIRRPDIGSQADVVQASQYWSERFNANPGDEKAAYAYSRALAAQDQRAQTVAVLQKAVLANGSSNFLKGELGKAMAANGQFTEALSVPCPGATAPTGRIGGCCQRKGLFMIRSGVPKRRASIINPPC